MSDGDDGGRWLLYGANGFTGELIAREAVRRGLRPTLAGRSAEAVGRLARELGCPVATFGLDDTGALASATRGVRAVLNCAGPFSATAAPVMQACLASGTHYLDITGEIDVFEAAHGLDAAARRAGAVLCPGVGFDVVPTDCVAAVLAGSLPDATYLALAFSTPGRPSRGTARTSFEGLRAGGRIRSAGRIVRVAHAFRVREIDFAGDGRTQAAVTIPWGDVSTAFHTTGIPNVETYMSLPAAQIRGLGRLNLLAPLLGLGLVRSVVERRIARSAPGPDQEARANSPTHVWGEAQAPSGESRVARLVVANGYDLTVHAALGLLAIALARDGGGGYFTPSQLAGARYVESLPGSGRIAVEAGRAWEPRAT